MKKDKFYSITANDNSWNTESRSEARRYFAQGAKVIETTTITIKEKRL